MNKFDRKKEPGVEGQVHPDLQTVLHHMKTKPMVLGEAQAEAWSRLANNNKGQGKVEARKLRRIIKKKHNHE